MDDQSAAIAFLSDAANHGELAEIGGGERKQALLFFKKEALASFRPCLPATHGCNTCMRTQEPAHE
jgi:hypothetical protein